MLLCKAILPSGERLIGKIDGDQVRPLDLEQVDSVRRLCDIVHHADPVGLARFLTDTGAEPVPLASMKTLAPVDHQEVWAAGVTYRRSQAARMEESEAGASHYDRVYSADRPELFFKATAQRVVPPDEPIRVRADSQWSVPEAELALVINPQKKVVGFTIGNDVSARDIEGENPLYLPQAKVYDQSCSLGPAVLIPERPVPREELIIELRIERDGRSLFKGSTDASQMARGFEELADWLTREYDIPDGAILLTGTGTVPPDEMKLAAGDTVSITIAGIGTLSNPVVRGRESST